MTRRSTARAFIALSTLVAASVGSAEEFALRALWQRSDGADVLRVEVGIPAGHKVYADSLRVTGFPEGVSAVPADDNPSPKSVYDDALGATSQVFSADVAMRYLLTGLAGREDLPVEVELLGCDARVCFPPVSRRFVLRPETLATGTSTDTANAAAAPKDTELFEGFEVVGSLVGYQSPKELLGFLEAARHGSPLARNPLAELFDRNRWLFALAVLGGGLLLNLTPCVLPMIPINLGIIGAGARASSRRRGFLLGGAYGLGITLAYGLLGVVSILTGSAFGTLQSSPWFSGGVALVFVVLALALFDVFVVDLSRFQKTGAPARAGTFGAALGLGALSALLAGACVAPVLIWTLLLAADLHRAGNAAGPLLPFLLGLGMALPWPFAGAGLSFLPKPGGWMNRVKQGFGVLVLVFAFHYARLAWQGLHKARAESPVAAADVQGAVVAWRPSLDAALDEARTSGQLVFVDLWATWCAACMKMDRTTLRDPQVAAALNAWVPVKVQCERPREPETAALMRALGAGGLPTYVVLQPAQILIVNEATPR